MTAVEHELKMEIIDGFKLDVLYTCGEIQHVLIMDNSEDYESMFQGLSIYFENTDMFIKMGVAFIRLAAELQQIRMEKINK